MDRWNTKRRVSFFKETMGVTGPRTSLCLSGAYARTQCEFHVRRLHFDFLTSTVGKRRELVSSVGSSCDVMQVTVAFDISLEGRDKALLSQQVENLVVGAPCGVMDQMTAVFGERDRLLLLLCQPAEIKRMLTLPQQLILWGIDSGICLDSVWRCRLWLGARRHVYGLADH